MKFAKPLALIAIGGAVLAGTAATCSKASPKDLPAAAATETPAAVPVTVSDLHRVTFEDRVDVSGSIQAKNTALVSARAKGALDTIYVDEGDAVVAEQTPLFQTDKVTLQNAAEAARQQVAVARAAAAAGEAGVARTEADLEKVQLDAERYRRLYNADRAITKSALETQESRLKQVTAGLQEAKAGLELSRAQAKQAESNLAIAEKNLADSLVLAPITGTVSERMLEPGEMADSNTAVLRIDDLTHLEVSAFLPEAYYERVTPGQTRVRLSSETDALGEYPLTFKSPVVDPRLRTFEIKADLDAPPAGVVPGRLVKVAVIMDQREGWGVPVDAVLTRADQKVIFIAERETAHQVPVQLGLQTNGEVEVVSDTLAPGMSVITAGQQFCNDGSGVKLVETE